MFRRIARFFGSVGGRGLLQPDQLNLRVEERRNMPQLSYRLPLSYLNLSGTVSFVTDTLAESPQEVREPDATVELRVTGDEAHPRNVSLDPGAWRDASASFEFAEDGRLVSGSREVIGQGGKLVTGVVHVATSLLSAAAAIGRPMPRFLATDFTIDATSEDAVAARAAAEQSAAERVEDAYKKAHPKEAELRATLRVTLGDLAARVPEAVRDAAAASTSAARRQALDRIRSLRIARAAAAEELDRMNAHFAAWRTTTQLKRAEDHEFKITLDELAMAKITVTENGDLHVPEPGAGDHPDKMRAAQAEIVGAWSDLGILVVVEDTRQRVLRHDVVDIPDAADSSLVVRTPRTVILKTFVRERDRNRAVLKAARPALVLDELCDHQSIDIRSGLFGEAKGGVSFSEDGVLAKVDFGTKSAAAAAAEAFGKVPESVASSLETASKIADAADKIRMRPSERAIARVTKQVELKQKELELSGLAATEADYAELLRLTQEAARQE